MFTHGIEIIKLSEERDGYNERVNEYVHVAYCYSMKTENGGRENLYASRIVHENEIVYTIRYREGIEAGQYIIDDGLRMKIISVHHEGRRKYLHIKTLKRDVES